MLRDDKCSRGYGTIDAGTMVNYNNYKLANNIAHKIGKMLSLKIQGNFKYIVIINR